MIHLRNYIVSYYEGAVEFNKKFPNFPYPCKFVSVQSLIAAIGYDTAKKWDVLEIYKDSWGVSMNRSRDAFTKHQHHFQEIENKYRSLLANS